MSILSRTDSRDLARSGPEPADTGDFRHAPTERPEAVFRLPDDPDPALLSRITSAYVEEYNFAAFPAIVMGLWRKGLLDIRVEEASGARVGYLPVVFEICQPQPELRPTPYERKVMDILALCGPGPVSSDLLEETIREKNTKVQLLLSQCAYAITEEVKGRRMMEDAAMPPQSGEHPQLSKNNRALLTAALLLCLAAGLLVPICFLGALIPTYFLFIRKRAKNGSRLTQEMEDLLAKWEGFYNFAEGIDQRYTGQAAQLPLEEWERAIPYLMLNRGLVSWLRRLPEARELSREPEFSGLRTLPAFFKIDREERAEPDMTLVRYFRQFERACIYVFNVSKLNRSDFSFKEDEPFPI